jgi:hypothetical protein
VSRKMKLAMGIGVFFLGLMVVASANAAVVRPATSYSVAFTEVGLASGTNWSVTFNSVTQYSTTHQIVFKSVTSAGYWSTPSTVAGNTTSQEYATPYTSGYMYVPNENAQVIPFTSDYKVAFAVSPAGTGSISPASTTFYPAGTQLVLDSAPNAGYHFASWKGSSTKITFDNASAPSTVATINAPGTITARFTVHTAPFQFYEVGLPTGTSWTAVFSGTSFGSSTNSIKTSYHPAGGYSFTVPTVFGSHGVEYVATPSSGSVSTPAQSTQQVVFTKEFQIAFATSPGTSGSVTPSTTAYYANGTSLPVTAFDSSTYVFSSWGSSNTGVGLGSKTTSSTNASIGASATLTAKFVTGTPCAINCTLNFTEIGLPSGTAWGVTVNSVTSYSSSTTITMHNLTSAISWSIVNPLSTAYNNAYYPTPSSGYTYLGSTNNQVVIFKEYVWVNIVDVPTGNSLGVTLGSGWYPMGATEPISAAVSPAFNFGHWASNTSNIVIGRAQAHGPSDYFAVGGAGTVTAVFLQTTTVATFEAFDLPKGTTWGVQISGLDYLTSHRELNVSIPSTSFYYYPISSIGGTGTGVEFNSVNYYGSLNLPITTFATVLYQKEYLVDVVAGGTSGGSVSPGGNTWYPAGYILPLEAINGTSVSFSSWSETATTGTISFGSSSSASTYATINGSGVITAKFA